MLPAKQSSFIFFFLGISSPSRELYVGIITMYFAYLGFTSQYLSEMRKEGKENGVLV